MKTLLILCTVLVTSGATLTPQNPEATRPYITEVDISVSCSADGRLRLEFPVAVTSAAVSIQDLVQACDRSKKQPQKKRSSLWES